MVNTKEIDSLKEKAVPVLKSYNVSRAGIFGSYARGEQKKSSDVDILIEIGIDADIVDIIRLKNLLEDKIGKKIDLVEYGCIRPELRSRILKEEVPIEL